MTKLAIILLVIWVYWRWVLIDRTTENRFKPPRSNETSLSGWTGGIQWDFQWSKTGAWCRQEADGSERTQQLFTIELLERKGVGRMIFWVIGPLSIKVGWTPKNYLQQTSPDANKEADT